MRNITLSAADELIDQARDKARAQGVGVAYHREPHQPHSYAVMALPPMMGLQAPVVEYLARVAGGGSGAPPPPAARDADYSSGGAR